MRKALNGRAATPADAEAGTVIFHIPDGRSVPYSFGSDLPLFAVIARDDLGDDFPPIGTVVEVLQAEQGDNGEILVGFMLGEQEFIGMLNDIQIIEEGSAS